MLEYSPSYQNFGGWHLRMTPRVKGKNQGWEWGPSLSLGSSDMKMKPLGPLLIVENMLNLSQSMIFHYYLEPAQSISVL